MAFEKMPDDLTDLLAEGRPVELRRHRFELSEPSARLFDRRERQRRWPAVAASRPPPPPERHQGRNRDHPGEHEPHHPLDFLRRGERRRGRRCNILEFGKGRHRRQ